LNNFLKMKNKNKSVFSSPRNPVFFVAEIGGNHEGDFVYAKFLTKLALDSGADAVKFQFYSGDTLVSPLESPDRNAHFKKFELSNTENLDLISIVNAGNSIPMASVWSSKMLEWANPHLPIHKVGSGDLTCYPMLSLLAETDKPIILSTGLSSMKEVASAVSYIEKCNPSYIAEHKLALLQCTSSYPTPDVDANIGAMLALKSEFGLPVGYSDHTLGSDAIEIAVSVGAEIVEKHFTNSRDGKTFRDHLIALTKEEVEETLNRMRHIKLLLGDGEKKLTKSEKKSEHHISFRRSIYASQNIKAGEKFTKDNLTVLRPYHGICASQFEDVLGCIAMRDFSAYQVLNKNDIIKK
jgi:N,N'-diacetyllegionaminate synthase